MHNRISRFVVAARAAADDVRRLKQLEAENARLKKLVAERDLEIEVMKEIAAKKW
jgi:putative transposase